MGILFKTYNGRHQLQIYRETWVINSKHQLEEILKIFDKKEAAKAKLTPVGSSIELELNGLIIECKDNADLKKKFGTLVDLKEQFQKILPATKVKK